MGVITSVLLQIPGSSVQQPPACHEQGRQGRCHLQPMQLPGQASVAYLLEAERAIDDADAVLELHPHRGLAPIARRDRHIDPAAEPIWPVGHAAAADAARRPANAPAWHQWPAIDTESSSSQCAAFRWRWKVQQLSDPSNLAGRRSEHRLNPQRHAIGLVERIAGLLREPIRHLHVEWGQLISPALAGPVQSRMQQNALGEMGRESPPMSLISSSCRPAGNKALRQSESARVSAWPWGMERLRGKIRGYRVRCAPAAQIETRLKCRFDQHAQQVTHTEPANVGTVLVSYRVP